MSFPFPKIEIDNLCTEIFQSLDPSRLLSLLSYVFGDENQIARNGRLVELY